MIPSTWTAVHRPSDGEQVGYLAPSAGDGRVVPTSLIGVPLASARDEAAAVTMLLADGLRSLDRRWWCRLPDPLPPSGALPAQTPAPDWQWRAVVLVEVSPAGCTARLEMAPPAQLRARAALPVPVGDLLREHPPE